jgi:molecular chaperone HscC
MPIIGIDLGTTNSLVAVLGPDGPRTLANEFDEHLTPSVVAVAEDGALLVGRSAKDRLVVAPGSGQAFFKRDMGTKTAYDFAGRSWTPTECSAHILAEMRRIAHMRLGEDCTRAVITVPAYFHDAQRQATMEAARIAGLTCERILNEPTAAALAFGMQDRASSRRLLVFDLGGGTFDVTIIETFEGVIEVKASAGESRLGGEDWTDALLGLVVGRLGAPIDDAGRSRLRQRVEVCKRRLTTADDAELEFDGQRIRVTREEFARSTAELLARLRPVMRRCLRDAGITPTDLDDVLLVGGASRMPDVVSFVASDLGRPPNRSLDPDRVVALGAAVQAALCADDAAVQDLVLTDVCPHTLGVEVAKSWAPGQQQAGYFSPIIDRNTTVPVSRCERYNTFHPDQDMIELQVYQGEGRLIKENTRLGTLRVAGLRHRLGQKEAGVIEVRFTYDMNGILEVEVLAVATGQRHSLVIESRPGAMTPAQIEEAVRRMAPLKLHPRDVLPNRSRLERGRRMWSELTGAARHALEARLDDFERALEAQDPLQIARAAAVLDSFLGAIYRDEGEHGDDDGRAG